MKIWRQIVAWFERLRQRIREEKAELRKGNLRVVGAERGRTYIDADLLPKPPSLIAAVKAEPVVTMKMKVIRANGSEEPEEVFRDQTIKVSRWGLIALMLKRHWRK